MGLNWHMLMPVPYLIARVEGEEEVIVQEEDSKKIKTSVVEELIQEQKLNSKIPRWLFWLFNLGFFVIYVVTPLRILIFIYILGVLVIPKLSNERIRWGLYSVFLVLFILARFMFYVIMDFIQVIQLMQLIR